MNPKTFFRAERRRLAADARDANQTPEMVNVAIKAGRKAVRRLLSTNGAGVTIDRINEALPEGVTLHPTKGYRVVSVASSKRSILTDRIRRGTMQWTALLQLALTTKGAHVSPA